jgi:hypothetical protein
MQQLGTENPQIVKQAAIFFGGLFDKPLDFQRAAN